VNVSPANSGLIRSYIYSAGSTSIINVDVTATKYPTSYTCFNINSTVYVQALPNSGWKFSKWTGNLDISTNPKSF